MSKVPSYVKWARKNGYMFRQYHYGDIGKADLNKRRKGIWQFDRSKDSRNKKRIYITSPCCGEISRLADHDVDRHGYVYDPLYSDSMGCVVCSCCESHFFVRLKDWKGRKPNA